MVRFASNWYYKGFKKKLVNEVGREDADAIWREALGIYEKLLSASPDIRNHKGFMVMPAVALFKALDSRSLDARRMLGEYGASMGKKFAGIVHFFTSLPGASKSIWKKVGPTMERNSSPQKGYRRRIVSEPPDMYGVDILSCPYHELAKQYDAEGAVMCICDMDKEYMKGFKYIRYERTTAVSEGAECCDYRLRFDPEKK
ncbi:MAG: L-2-amino-thiazoline-4-carboxylic acid hydrolase [Lachnospiraceae bacterium]|nr:L-2-amino-thiazoline-4-carboxylic acid hydrolase [Lachnospiraceae bacterium]